MITLLKDIIQYRYFLLFWTVRQIKSQYHQSLFGSFWKVVQPLLMTLLFVLINTVIPLASKDIPYPLFVFAAIFPWTLFSTTITAASESIIGNSEIIKKIYFPREILVIQAFGSPLVDFVVAFVIWIILKIAYKSSFTWFVVLVPIILVVQLLLALGLGLLVTSVNFIRRDINYARSLILQGWFYLTPIVYSPEVIPKHFRWWYNLNPMVGLIQSYRAILINGQLPEIEWLLWPMILALFLLIAGYKLFKKKEPMMADII